MLVLSPLNVGDAIGHGFFGRVGGVSRGRYASLNCGFGSGDEREDVAENRRRAMAALGLEGAGLVTAHQIHSPDVVEVTAPWAPGAAPRGDAMVTRTPGIGLGVLTADCVPVLLADPGAGVVGAAHAGWKGALKGVVQATVDAMVALGAERGAIEVAVGPAIGGESYEVGPEFPRPFTDQDPANRRFFRPARRDGHFLFDLKGYVASRLSESGIECMHVLAEDTYREDSSFFSYRRAVHQGEKDYGRALSVISLKRAARESGE